MLIKDLMPAGLEFGNLIKFRGLGVLPVLNSQAPEIEVLTLDEALNRGEIEIREINEGGSVPFLDVENRGEKPVLILDGEELVGGLQNRVVNVTVMIKARATLQINVACVERGRWSHRSPRFGSGMVFRASSRAVHKQGVAANIRNSGVPLADQGAVWNQVQRTLDEVGARSRTNDFQDARRHVEHRIEEFVEAIRPVEHQIGSIVVGEQERVRGVELLATPDLYSRCHEKIVASFAFDALKARHLNGVSPDPIKAWWNRMLSAPISRQKAIGTGDHVQTEVTDVIGTGLIDDRGRLIHLSCFPLVPPLPLNRSRKTGRSSATDRKNRLRSSIQG